MQSVLINHRLKATGSRPGKGLFAAGVGVCSSVHPTGEGCVRPVKQSAPDTQETRNVRKSSGALKALNSVFKYTKRETEPKEAEGQRQVVLFWRGVQSCSRQMKSGASRERVSEKAWFGEGRLFRCVALSQFTDLVRSSLDGKETNFCKRHGRAFHSDLWL